MAAPLTALALRPKAAGVKPPLVKVKTRLILQRGEAPELSDTEIEANLDPLEILKAAGVGILVGGVALAAGWLLWDGLAAPTPFGTAQVFRGVKESPYWREQAATAQECGKLRSLIRQRRAIMKTPGCDEACQEQMEKEIEVFEAKKASLGCLR